MRTSRLAWTFLVLAILAISAPAYADQNQKSSTLSITLNGGTLSSGDQFYSQSGGVFVGGMILGMPVDPSQANLQFGLRAHVSGLSVSGEASFNLAINNVDGSVTKVHGDAPISGMLPAVTLPPSCKPGVCQSAVPALFLGLASVKIQTCNGQDQGSDSHARGNDGNSEGGSNCSPAKLFSFPMQFESAYLNPFGGPIFIASQGGEILIFSTYSHANIVWKGIQLGGIVSGTLNGNPVAGGFAMTVTAHEDLLAGTESEEGNIALVGMNPSSLNAQGHFEGSSTIPTGTPCDPSLGFPPGTCTVTGLNSQGSFSMHNSGSKIKGSYSITWMAPAFAFSGSASAIVSNGGSDGGD